MLDKFHYKIASKIYIHPDRPGFQGYDEAAKDCYKFHLNLLIKDLEKISKSNIDEIKEDIKNKINETYEIIKQLDEKTN